MTTTRKQREKIKIRMERDSLTSLIESRRQHRRQHDPHREHRLQRACVEWFRLQYPRLRLRLFAVPNGGKRDPATAAQLRAEGALPGVADLVLLVPACGCGALLIEMKTTAPGSRQSQAQSEWQQDLTSRHEYQYAVCRTIDDFILTIRQYLAEYNTL